MDTARFGLVKPLPFIYESTGTITCFTDGTDPKPRFREVFSFHRPEELARLLRRGEPLRAALLSMPPLADAASGFSVWIN